MKKAPLLCLAILGSVAIGCASGDASPASDEGQIVADLPPRSQQETVDDATLVTKLETALAGVTFVSDNEFPWTVVEGDGKGVTTIDAAAVDARLGGVIEALEATEGRDLARVRTEEHSFDELFDRLEEGFEHEAVAYEKARALLTTNLTDLRFFKFDVKEGGDQDTGPIIMVVVGRSASDRLIALVTYDVAT